MELLSESLKQLSASIVDLSNQEVDIANGINQLQGEERNLIEAEKNKQAEVNDCNKQIKDIESELGERVSFDLDGPITEKKSMLLASIVSSHNHQFELYQAYQKKYPPPRPVALQVCLHYLLRQVILFLDPTHVHHFWVKALMM